MTASVGTSVGVEVAGNHSTVTVWDGVGDGETVGEVSRRGEGVSTGIQAINMVTINRIPNMVKRKNEVLVSNFNMISDCNTEGRQFSKVIKLQDSGFCLVAIDNIWDQVFIE